MVAEVLAGALILLPILQANRLFFKAGDVLVDGDCDDLLLSRVSRIVAQSADVKQYCSRLVP